MRTPPDDSTYLQAIECLAGLLKDARNARILDCDSASLATCSLDARPSVRTVDVVRISPSGIVFFARQDSGKGLQMRQNPRAGMCFHWPNLRRQAIAEGRIEILSAEASDELWNQRPRDVSLGHWASEQDRRTETGNGLRVRLEEVRRRYDYQRPPRAPGWIAFELQPDRIEFWKTGWDRLNSRLRYLEGRDGTWTEDAVNP